MTASNEEIAQLFENMGVLLEIKGDSIFKIRAYQRAARTINDLSFPLSTAVDDGMDLKKIPGIGKGERKVVDSAGGRLVSITAV